MDLVFRLALTGVAFWGVGAAIASVVFGVRQRSLALAVALALLCASAAWSVAGLCIWNDVLSSGSVALLCGVVSIACLLTACFRASIALAVRNWLATTLTPLLGGAVLLGTLACLYTKQEFNALDIEAIGRRTHSYPTIDAALQYRIAQNFLERRDIETGFRLDGVGLWSAGDRPLWFGFLDATLAQATGVRGVHAYLFRFYCVHAMLWLLTGYVLARWLGVARRRERWLLLAAGFVTPFWWIQSIYTWPKVTGLVFAIAGGLLLAEACSQPQVKWSGFPAAAGMLFAFAQLCHTNTVFAIAAASALVLIANHRRRIPFDRRTWLLVALPYLLLLQIHSRYVTTHTHETHLLTRMNLCLDGSYAFPTPVVSVRDACTRYLRERGIAGALSDRYASLRVALWSGYDMLPALARLREWRSFGPFAWTHYLGATVVSYGIWSVPIFGLALLLSLRSRRPFSATVLFCGLGVAALLGFGAMVAAHTEVVPHALPFAIHWLFAVGSTHQLFSLGRPVGTYVLVGFALWGFATLAAALLPVVVFSPALVVSAIGMGLTFATARAYLAAPASPGT